MSCILDKKAPLCVYVCHQKIIYSTLLNLNCIESSRYFYQFNNSSKKQKKVKIVDVSHFLQFL